MTQSPLPLRIVLLTKDASWGEALARDVTQRHGDTVEFLVTDSRPAAMAWIRCAADRRILVVAELHVDIPNQGLESLLYARRIHPQANLVLLAPTGRFDSAPLGIDLVLPKEALAPFATLEGGARVRA